MPRWTDDRLREAIQIGLDDLAAGRFTTINNKEELIAFFEQLSDPNECDDVERPEAGEDSS